MADAYIHESCYIDDGATIGDNTKIWHFCHILENTIIGQNCNFGQNCSVGPDVIIGNNVKVQNNISIYEGIVVEDDVFLGPSCVFTNILNPRSFISRKSEFKKTVLKKGCTIGANATILCGIQLGEYSLIGAGSVVTKDVKAFSLVYGSPAKHMGWVGISGNKLKFNEEGLAVDQYDMNEYRFKDNNVNMI